MGKITIGVGRNLTDRGLAQDEITLLFENDIKLSSDILDSLFTYWHEFPIQARHALISMAFNLGGPRLTKFKKMRAALENRDFLAAAEEARASLRARQVSARVQMSSKCFERRQRLSDFDLQQNRQQKPALISIQNLEVY